MGFLKKVGDWFGWSQNSVEEGWVCEDNLSSELLERYRIELRRIEEKLDSYIKRLEKEAKDPTHSNRYLGDNYTERIARVKTARVLGYQGLQEYIYFDFDGNGFMPSEIIALRRAKKWISRKENGKTVRNIGQWFKKYPTR